MTALDFLLFSNKSKFRQQARSLLGASVKLDEALRILTRETPIPPSWEIVVDGKGIRPQGAFSSDATEDYIWMKNSVPEWIVI